MPGKIAMLATLLVLAAGYAYGLEVRGKTYPYVNGVQLFVMDQSYANDPGAFFRELKNKGINTVFFRVFHNSGDRPHLNLPNICPQGGVYFRSSTACTISDLLPVMAEYARANDIKIYAWMATRSLSFLKTPDNMTQSFMPDGVATGYGANILRPEVRKALQDLFTELAGNNIDGILIQDDFIMKYNEGADRLSCDAFTRTTGIACTRENFFTVVPAADDGEKFGPYTDKHTLWMRWKSDELLKLFSSLRYKARLVNPKLMWAVNIYYETPVYPDKGMAWYAQDMDAVLAAGADYLAVMAYHEQIASEMRLGRNGTLDFLEKLGTSAVASAKMPSRAIFKIQVKRFDSMRTPMQAAEVKLVRNRLEKAGGVSFVELPVDKAADVIVYP